MCGVEARCGVCSVLWRVEKKDFEEQVLVEVCATEHKFGPLPAEGIE